MSVDREDALDLLPEAHALALRLLENGADMAVIANRVEIEPEAVPLLLRVAGDKLATLLDGPAPGLHQEDE